MIARRHGLARLITPALLRNAVRTLAAMALAWVLWNVILSVLDANWRDTIATAPRSIIMAAAFYLAGHGVRIVRLALLIANARLSLRQLAGLHFVTAGVALGVPWRLGDGYRVVELGALTGSMMKGMTLVWIERLLDAAFLVPMLLIALVANMNSGPALGSTYVGITGFLVLFVVVSIMVVALLPDNLRRVGTYLIRRHERAWTVWVLRGIDEVRTVMRSVPATLRGKMASLAALTLLVWLFEVLAFGTIVVAWQPAVNPLPGLLSFLSQTTTNGTLPEMLNDAAGTTLGYLISSQMLLAGVAALAGFYTLKFIRRKGRA